MRNQVFALLATVADRARLVWRWLRLKTAGAANLTLQHYLVLLTLGATLPLIALAFGVVMRVAQAERNQSQAGLMASARALATAVDREVEKHLLLAHALARSRSLRSGNLAEFRRQAREVLAVVPGAWLSIADSTGQLRVSTVEESRERPALVANLELQEQVLKTGEPRVSDVYVAVVTGQPTAAVLVPVYRYGAPHYVMIMSLNPERFHKLLVEQNLPAGWLAGILDRRGRFVARLPDQQKWVGQEASAGWRAAIKEAPEGMAENVSLEGDTIINVYTRAGHGWTVGVAVPKSMLEAPQRNTLFVLSLSAAALLLMSLAFAWVLGRRLTSGTTLLSRAAAALEQEQPVAAEPTGVHDYDRLMATFAHASSLLRARHEEQARMLKRMHESEERLRAIVEGAMDGIIAINERGIVQSLNPAAVRIFGYTAQEVVGQNVNLLMPEPYRSGHDSYLRSYLHTGTAKIIGIGREVMGRRKDGTTFPMDLAVAAAATSEGRLFIGVVRDITERKKAEDSLRDSERRLELALTAGHMGAWEWNIDTGQVTWSPGLEAIHGLNPGMFGGRLEDFKKDIYPEDLESVLAQIQQAVDTGGNYHVTYRIERADGAVRWLEAFGRFVRGADGKPQKLAGICMDITERKQAEERQSQLAAIVEFSRDAIMGKSLDGIVTSWNPAAEALFGYSAAEMIGQPIQRLIPANRIAEEDKILARLGAGQSVEHYDTERVTKDGRLVPVSVTISPIKDRAGGIIGASKVVRDITQRKKAEEQINLLMREVNHRAKNLLSVVQAIAGQTAKDDESRAFLQRFSKRIAALAASQDLLVSNEWQGAGVAELVRSQLAHFNELVGTRIQLNGPLLSLTPAATQAIGMALHELTTNAAKYGALSNVGGCVKIEWGLVMDGKKRAFRMRWSEHGGPPVKAPNSKGFGSTVLVDMVQMATDGEVRLDYAATGIVWDLTSPASHLLEEGMA